MVFTSGIFYQSPVCNKLDETACDRLDLTSLLRFVSTNLLQAVNLHATSLLSTICYSIVTTTLLQVRQQVGTSPSTSWCKSVRTSCYRQCEDILLTSCWNNIATSLLQACYNLCVFTCVNNKKSRATRSSLHGEVDQTNEAEIHELQSEHENVLMGFDDYNSADKTIYDPHISENVSADDIEAFEVIFLQQYK